MTDDILDFVRVCKASHPKVGVRRLVPLIERKFGNRLHPPNPVQGSRTVKKKTLKPVEETLNDKDLRRYRRWRQAWRSGHLGRGFPTLHRHGMAVALRLATPVSPLPEPSTTPDHDPVPDLLIKAEVDMIENALNCQMRQEEER